MNFKATFPQVFTWQWKLRLLFSFSQSFIKETKWLEMFGFLMVVTPQIILLERLVTPVYSVKIYSAF